MKLKIINKYTGCVDYNICLCSDGELIELHSDSTWSVVDKEDYIIKFVEE